MEKREVADKRTPLEQLVSRPYGFTTSLSMIVQEMDLSLDDRDPVLNFTLGDEHETVVLFVLNCFSKYNLLQANSTKAVLVDLLDLGPFVSLSNQAFVSSKIEELQDDYIGMMVEMKVTVSGDNPRTYQVVDFDPEPQDNNASSSMILRYFYDYVIQIMMCPHLVWVQVLMLVVVNAVEEDVVEEVAEVPEVEVPEVEVDEVEVSEEDTNIKTEQFVL